MGISPFDDDFKIDWKIDKKNAVLSEKDGSLGKWSEIEKFINF
jgi:dTDP-4-dehydrorhamnose 3,5-epimerase-like enzyme